MRARGTSRAVEVASATGDARFREAALQALVFERTVFVRSIDFYNSHQFLLVKDKRVKIDLRSASS